MKSGRRKPIEVRLLYPPPVYAKTNFLDRIIDLKKRVNKPEPSQARQEPVADNRPDFDPSEMEEEFKNYGYSVVVFSL